MTQMEKRLSKALTRLVAEIETMACTMPSELSHGADEDEQDKDAWFGGFLRGDGVQDVGAVIAWPNLRILVEELRPLIDENDVIGVSDGPPYDAATATGMYDHDGG